jgi:hypothetical protein
VLSRHRPKAYQAGSSTAAVHGQMMPAPAAVACPGQAASISVTWTPSLLAVYAQAAPTTPEPTMISRMAKAYATGRRPA